MKIILAIIALAMPFYCIAGRPVFHDFSLADLVQGADVIALVSKVEPFEETKKDSGGCDRVQWHLMVHGFLKNQRQVHPEVQSSIHVLTNVTSVRDCTLREGWQNKGASFSAFRYKPSEPEVITDREFLVFLVVKNGFLELVTDDAVESINRKIEVESLLSGTQQRRTAAEKEGAVTW